MAGVERYRFPEDIQQMTRSRTTSERSNGMDQRGANSLNAMLPPGEESNLPFPKLLRQRRRELDISQEQLAERAGGSWRTADIIALESGRVLLPSWDRLLALAEADELPADALLQACCPSGDDNNFAEFAQSA